MQRHLRRILFTQNIGIFNRCFRLTFGILILDSAIAHLQMDGNVVTWTEYLAWISLYPILTGLLGWDCLHAFYENQTTAYPVKQKNWSQRLSLRYQLSIKRTRVKNKTYRRRQTTIHKEYISQ